MEAAFWINDQLHPIAEGVHKLPSALVESTNQLNIQKADEYKVLDTGLVSLKINLQH